MKQNIVDIWFSFEYSLGAMPHSSKGNVLYDRCYYSYNYLYKTMIMIIL